MRCEPKEEVGAMPCSAFTSMAQQRRACQICRVTIVRLYITSHKKGPLARASVDEITVALAVMAVVPIMMAAVREGDRLKVEASYSRRDIQSGLALQTDRL